MSRASPSPLPPASPARCTPRARGSPRCGGWRCSPPRCCSTTPWRWRRSRSRCSPPAGGRGWAARWCRALRTALIVAIPIVLINVIASREGLTVFARLGDLGPFGQGDLTVEALVYGAVIALKVTVLILITALCQPLHRPRRAAADLPPPLVPLGAHRLAGGAHDPRARRRRPADRRGAAHTARDGGRPTGRRRGARAVALIGAMLTGSLDRAMDVAATLELRGFAAAPRAPRLSAAVVAPRPCLLPPPRWRCSRSRCSPGSAASASFTAYPLVHAPVEPRAVRALRSARACDPAAVRRPPGDRAVNVLSFHDVTYHYPGAGRPRSTTSASRLPPGEFCLLAGLSGHGKSTLLRAACGLVPHFHGGRFAGRVRARRPRHSRARARAPRDARRRALPGPREQLVMSSVRAELALALESRGHAAAAVARGVEEVGARARHRPPARPPHPHALRRRGPAGRARRRALRAPARAAARRAHLAARPRRRRRADRAAAAPQPGVGRRPCCSPSTAWSAACPPPTACSRCATAASPTTALRTRSWNGQCARSRRCRPPARGCSRSPASARRRSASSRPAQPAGAQPVVCRTLYPPPRPLPLRTAVQDDRRRGVPNWGRAGPPAGPPPGQVLAPPPLDARPPPRCACAACGTSSTRGPAILRGAELRVEPGESVALMGRNGAGKSTLLRHAAGLLEPTRGRIERGGRVALLLQNPGDYFAARARLARGLRRARSRTCRPRRPRRAQPPRPLRRRAPAPGARDRHRRRRGAGGARAGRAHARHGPPRQGAARRGACAAAPRTARR